MTTSIRLPILTSLFLSLVVSLPAAEPTLEAISKTWSGLDKSSRPKSLYEMVITFEPAPNQEQTSVENTRTAAATGKGVLGQQASPNAFQSGQRDASRALQSMVIPKLPGLNVRGTMESTLLNNPSGGATAPMTDQFEGVYYPEIGLLTFQRVGRGHYAGGASYAVFDEEATEMSLVFSGARSNHLPVSLFAGEEVPASIQALAEIGTSPQSTTTSRTNTEPQNPTPVVQNRRTAPTTPPQTTPAPSSRAARQEELKAIQTQYQQDSKALQARISEATRARDRALVTQLRQEQKSLREAYNQQIADFRARNNTRNQNNARTPNTSRAQNPSRAQSTTQNNSNRNSRTRGSGLSPCPEHILAWATEMENNGASLREFPGFLVLANLFRPTAFVPHFGKALSELTNQEFQDLVYQIQRPCANDGSALARGGTRIPLSNVLGRPTQWGITEMAIAGVANQNVAAWIERMITYLETEASLSAIETFKAHSELLLRLLWPNERSRLETTLPHAENRAVIDLIEENLASMTERLEAKDHTAVHELHYFKASGLFERLFPDDAQRMTDRYQQEAVSAIQKSWEQVRRDLQSISDPQEHNRVARDWWPHGQAAMNYFGEHLDTEAVIQWLGTLREENWKRWKTALFAQIGTIKTLHEVKLFLFNLSIQPVDKDHCPTWHEIEADRKERVKEIEYELFLARVGEGPFGPDYPGAILLNAVYRNDRRQIVDENELLIDSLLFTLHPSERGYLNYSADTGMSRLKYFKTDDFGNETVLMDAVFYNDPWGGRLHASARRSSFVEPLMRLFATHYKELYPDCMDANLVINQRHTPALQYQSGRKAERVETFVPGTLERTLVVSQFVDIFEAVWGEGGSGTSGLIYSPLFKGNWNESKEEIQLLTDALQGLRQAMEERPCDDPVIQQLDKHLIELCADKVGHRF